MSEGRPITPKPVSGISCEQELDTLATVYAYLIKWHESKKAAPSSRPVIHFDSQAREGASHDLTRNQITEAPKTDRGKT